MSLGKKSQRDIKKLVKQAIDALEIVLNDAKNSELRQMWEEQAGEMPAWTTAMTTLQQRLHKIAVP